MALRSIKGMTLAVLVCCAALNAATGAGAAEPIRIGAVLPFSGGVELYGGQARLGLDLAAREIKAIRAVRRWWRDGFP